MGKSIKLTFSTLFVIFFFNTLTKSESVKKCTSFKDAAKFDCHPENGSTKESCEKRGCCWMPGRISTRPTTVNSIPLDVPWCYYPEDFGGYEYINLTRTEKGDLAFMRRTFSSPYPNDAQILKIDIEYQADNRLRVKITDAENSRYESLYPKIAYSGKESFSTNPTYRVDVDLKKTGFRVSRNDGTILFNSQGIGGFTFADQFLQISSTIPGKMYGLGEHRSTFWLDTNWTRFTMFAHDSPPQENINLYGSHPFYLVMEPDGRSHGVYLHNSNAMDILLQPLPAVTYRTIGGILDFYFFLGPTPADVIRQYTELVGRPFLPPYWSLGFQLSKYGYGSTEETRKVWERTRNAKIPFDVQYNDIDYMHNQNDFTIDPIKYKDLPELVKDIHSAGMRYILILDPGVSASEPHGKYPPYDEGVAEDVFVKNSDGSIFIGKVWNPQTTVFPDFTHPKVQKYWKKQILKLHEKIPFDGLWIDMNEPANFLNGTINGCPNNKLENPPYMPGVDKGNLNYKTLCMSAKHFAGNHYDLHNLYGISQSDVTLSSMEAITGKRGFVLSRSTFVGSGKYVAHWTGDNFSTWHDLTKSIPALLSFNLYGIPFVGADICGFIGNTTKSLCKRWMQLGAFYPFSRNHNSIGNMDQDPAAFDSDVIISSVNALTIRYSLLPYLYTLFYKAHVYGDTVARPLFFEFPGDEKTYEIDRAFLWGSGLYIIPITEDNTNKVKAYLPIARWYDWYNLTEVTSTGEVTLETDEFHIPLLIRGGTIFPLQKPALTTTQSRNNDFSLLVVPDANGTALGDLFWDDGISSDTIKNNEYGLLKFNMTHNHFVSKVEKWNITTTPNLESIKILETKRVTNVILNKINKTFINEGNILQISNINLPINTEIDLTWT